MEDNDCLCAMVLTPEKLFDRSCLSTMITSERFYVFGCRLKIRCFKNAEYVSPRIQNELIQLCGDIIKE